MFHGGCEIPEIYNITSTDNLITQVCDDFYLKLEIGDSFTNINFSNYYDKSYIDYLDNEISTQFLNTYTKAELDSLLANINLSDYCTKAEMDLILSNIDLSNYYTKTEIDDIDNELPTLILNTYTKTEVDTLLFNSSSQSFSAMSLISLELGLNYKTAIQLAETYYSKAEVDNLITFDPNFVYTKTEINSI